MFTSCAAKQMISAFLTVNPEQRLRVGQGLQTKWFADHLSMIERMYASTITEVP